MVAKIDQHLGARLALAREERGVTPEDLAKRIEIAVQRLVAFEHGAVRIPSIYVARLARALDVTPRWLFDGLPGQDAFDRTG